MSDGKELRHDRYDALVAGGGPAGATAATLLAQKGHRVALLERAAEPQFKVGESLMPATYWIFERLGVLERMKRSFFPKKTSVQFFSASGRASSPFYFEDHDPHESSRTWQVLRSEFDRILLENAAEQGVEVLRGAHVREVLFDGERAEGLRFEAGGREHRAASRVVVDATGQSTLIAGRLGLKEVADRLKNASLFTHFEGAQRDVGRDEGATLILHTRSRKTWFWYIPLPEDRVSVGVVGPVDYLLKGRVKDPQAVFDQELAGCPALAPRLAEARQAMPIRATRDFSYRSSRLAGEGWVLVGDAFGFIDPIYSTGVFLALKSGELAADTVATALDDDDLSAERLGSHGPELLRGMEALGRLVYAFYDEGFSFSAFLERHPECRGPLVDMLVGNVYRRPVDRVVEALDAWQPTADLVGERA